MTPKSIRYSRGTTVNLGDFESVRIDMSADADLDDGETLEAGMKDLKDQVDELVRAEVRHVRAQIAKRQAKRQQSEG